MLRFASPNSADLYASGRRGGVRHGGWRWDRGGGMEWREMEYAGERKAIMVVVQEYTAAEALEHRWCSAGGVFDFVVLLDRAAKQAGSRDVFSYVTHQKLATGLLLVPLARVRCACACHLSPRSCAPLKAPCLHRIRWSSARCMVCCKGRMACPPCLLHIHENPMFSCIDTVVSYGRTSHLTSLSIARCAAELTRALSRLALIDIPRIANGMVRVSRRRPSHYERSVRRPAIDKVISLDSFTHRRY